MYAYSEHAYSFLNFRHNVHKIFRVRVKARVSQVSRNINNFFLRLTFTDDNKHRLEAHRYYTES
jgi:hypothetical protein